MRFARQRAHGRSALAQRSADRPRKTGGILVESKIEGRHGWPLPWSALASTSTSAILIAGCATPATSLDLECGRRISRQALLVALLESLEREAAGLLDPDAVARIPARVEQASTWIRGRQVEVHGPQACTGVTAGLDENGFLLVQTGGWT